MIRVGVSLILIAVVLYVLGFLAIIATDFVVIFGFAILFAVVGTILTLIGVAKDRVKEKKEEENRDYSKY